MAGRCEIRAAGDGTFSVDVLGVDGRLEETHPGYGSRPAARVARERIVRDRIARQKASEAAAKPKSLSESQIADLVQRVIASPEVQSVIAEERRKAEATRRADELLLERVGLALASPETFEERQAHAHEAWQHKVDSPDSKVGRWVAEALNRPAMGERMLPPTPSRTTAEVATMSEREREHWRADQWRPGGVMYESVIPRHAR